MKLLWFVLGLMLLTFDIGLAFLIFCFGYIFVTMEPNKPSWLFNIFAFTLLATAIGMGAWMSFRKCFND